MRFNRLSDETRARVVGCLVEGMGVRSTARANGIAINSVQAIIRDVGPRCRCNHDRIVCDLKTTRVQADEMWGFVGCRDANVPAHRRGEFGIGDAWMWLALDRDARLVASYMVGKRQSADAHAFLAD